MKVDWNRFRTLVKIVKKISNPWRLKLVTYFHTISKHFALHNATMGPGCHLEIVVMIE